MNQTCELNVKTLSQDEIRELAYFRWLAATGGEPVSEEESRKFWIEAENQLFQNN